MKRVPAQRDKWSFPTPQAHKRKGKENKHGGLGNNKDVSETKISFEQSEIRNNRQSEAAENTIDEKESPKKQKMMTIRKELQKK